MSLYSAYSQSITGPWQEAPGGVRYRIERVGAIAKIYFQYTYTAAQVLTDIDFLPRLYKDEPEPWRVHGGFGKAFKSFIKNPAVLAQLEGLVYFEIFGYSYGGAIATLMHEWLWFNDHPDVYTVTFGAPDVCCMPSKSIKARFENLFNVGIRGDIVRECLPHAFPGFTRVGVDVTIGPRSFPSWAKHGEYDEWLSRIG